MKDRAGPRKAALALQRDLKSRGEPVFHPPVRIRVIAEAYFGYNVRHADPPELPPDCSGMLDRARKMILVRRSDPSARINFSIAHEIGHLVLHPKDGIDCRTQRAASAEEREADEFAAAFLLPRESLLRVCHEQRQQPPTITFERLVRIVAERFSVSMEAARVELLEALRLD